MLFQRHFVLFLLCSLQIFAATTYTIQPLNDAAQPEFSFSIPTPGFGFTAVNNTPFLGGRTSTGDPALGTLNGNTFTAVSLPPLAGGDLATLGSTLKDGSAIGLTTTFNPNPNPISANVPALRFTRWVNGVPSEIVISDPNQPNAVLTQGPIAMSSEGDIVGRYLADGVVSAYRYNVFDETFEVIALPSGASQGFTVSSLNERRQILALAQLPNPNRTAVILYDSGTKSWKEIELPPATFITSPLLLNSEGGFATTLLDFSVFSAVAFRFDGMQIVPLYTDPAPLPGQPTVFGFNRQGVAVGAVADQIGLFQDGGFVEIGSRITNPEGWGGFSLGPALLVGINDEGQIFGNGLFEGRSTSFVLQPNAAEVPEPGTGLLGVAAVAMVLTGWRRG